MRHHLLLCLIGPVFFGFFGCDREKSSDIPNVPFPNDYRRLIGVSDPQAPNKLLSNWQLFSFDGYGGAIQRAFDKNKDSEILEGVFDADRFYWSESLRTEIEESKDIVWLKMGRHVGSFGFENILKLKSLKGLSLQGANLTGVRLEDLNTLDGLKWLDVSYTRIGESKLPELPELQVLVMHKVGKQNDVSLLPTAGQFPKLKTLIFTYSRISDLEVKQLSLACPNLEFLNLAFSEKVTTNAIEDFAKLNRLRFLQLCDTSLANNRVASGEWAIFELRRRLPKCYIDVAR